MRRLAARGLRVMGMGMFVGAAALPLACLPEPSPPPAPAPESTITLGHGVARVGFVRRHREVGSFVGSGTRRLSSGATEAISFTLIGRTEFRRETLAVSDGRVQRYRITFLEKSLELDGTVHADVVEGKTYLVDCLPEPRVTTESLAPVSDAEAASVLTDTFPRRKKASTTAAASEVTEVEPLRIGGRADAIISRFLDPRATLHAGSCTLTGLRDTKQGEAALFALRLDFGYDRGGLTLQLSAEGEGELRVEDGAVLDTRLAGTFAAQKGGVDVVGKFEFVSQNTYE